MAHVDDKARFYLERAVPQLREFEEKEIFSREEIRTLVQKRTDHERTILSPGNQPSDFLAYIEWEESLDRLRAKRCHRLKIRKSTSHAAQSRIFQTFERAVSYHPGSVLLWRRYLAFAAQAKATKRWRAIMTRALRMLPTDDGLWVVAGQRAADEGDMATARSTFLRGCRFCTSTPTVWVAYARAEMRWLVQLQEKHQQEQEQGNGAFAKALQDERDQQAEAEEGNGEAIDFGMGDDDNDDDDDDEDRGNEDFSNVAVTDDALAHMVKGKRTPQQKQPKQLVDQAAADRLASSPAMSGALPRAIFDIAAKQPFFNAAAAAVFLAMFAKFPPAQADPQIQHVLATLADRFPHDPVAWSCRAQQPLLGVSTTSPAFPRALREARATLLEGRDAVDNKAAYAKYCTVWLDSLLGSKDLDAGLRAVLEDTKKKVVVV